MTVLAVLIKEATDGFNRLARPFLTMTITVLFNGMAAWAFLMGKITWTEFAAAVGAPNAMIIGFWFGERAALKVPGEKRKEPEEP